jgi:anaerobic selenocysteine-containing dehydrogenase
MCDEGRLSYKQVAGEDRLREPQLRAADGQLMGADFDAAIEEAAARIRRAIDVSGPGVVVALASPHATNEDLFTLRRLLEVLGTSNAAGVAVSNGRSDELLIKAEKAANAAGTIPAWDGGVTKVLPGFQLGRAYPDTSIGSHAAGKKGNSRCGHRTHQLYIRAHGTDSRGQGCLQHVAGQAGVLADQYFITVLRISPKYFGQ